MSTADRLSHPATRLGLYALALVAVFVVAFLGAGAIAPEGAGEGTETDVVEHETEEVPGERDGH